MKKLSFVVALMLAFALSVWAQTPSTNDTQSGAGSSASQSSPSSSGSMGSPSTSSQTSGSMGQGNTSTAEPGKGKEHKMKGCLESEGGSYILREKNGKEIPLTGSADLSQYANHEVAVHGDWSTGAAAPSSSTSDMSKSGSEKQFTVDKVDSLSDTCKGAKKAEKDKGMSNNPNSTSPPQ